MTGSRRQSGVVVAWQWEQDFCFAAASTGLRPEGIVGVLPDDEGEGVGGRGNWCMHCSLHPKQGQVGFHLQCVG